MAGKTSRKRRTGISVIAILVLIICGIIMYKTIQVDKDLAAARDKLESLEKELTEAESEELVISEKKDYIGSDEYIEDIAREQLGLVYPDELLIVPDGSEIRESPLGSEASDEDTED